MPSLSFLAVLLGVALVITRLPGIFYPREFYKALKPFMKEEPFLRMFAILPLLFSVSILVQVGRPVWDWTALMTVLGWLLLLGAVFLMWWPHVIQKKIMKTFFKSEGVTAFACLVGVALGVGLIYLGLYVY